MRSPRWADIPESSMRGRRCSPSCSSIGSSGGGMASILGRVHRLLVRRQGVIRVAVVAAAQTRQDVLMVLVSGLLNLAMAGPPNRGSRSQMIASSPLPGAVNACLPERDRP